MDIGDLRNILALLENTSVTEFEWKQGDSKFKITRGTTSNIVTTSTPSVPVTLPASTQSEEKSADENLCKVDSPIVGNYYSRPSPDADQFVQVGSKVHKGDTLCIIEAMKFMNEIDSPVNGVIEKIFLSEGQVVEYGETLFLIRPE